MNEAMTALTAYIDQRQQELLAELEAIRAIRTLLVAQQEKPAVARRISALKEIDRILEELPHAALTPQLRGIAQSAKQALLDELFPTIQLLADHLEAIPPDVPPTPLPGGTPGKEQP
jgi:hypothetical protein